MDQLVAALLEIVGEVVEAAEVLVEMRAVARAEAVRRPAEGDPGDLGRATAEDLEVAVELEAQDLDLAGDLAVAGTVEVVAGNSSSYRTRDVGVEGDKHKLLL